MSKNVKSLCFILLFSGFAFCGFIANAVDSNVWQRICNPRESKLPKRLESPNLDIAAWSKNGSDIVIVTLTGVHVVSYSRFIGSSACFVYIYKSPITKPSIVKLEGISRIAGVALDEINEKFYMLVYSYDYGYKGYSIWKLPLNNKGLDFVGKEIIKLEGIQRNGANSIVVGPKGKVYCLSLHDDIKQVNILCYDGLSWSTVGDPIKLPSDGIEFSSSGPLVVSSEGSIYSVNKYIYKKIPHPGGLTSVCEKNQLMKYDKTNSKWKCLFNGANNVEFRAAVSNDNIPYIAYFVPCVGGGTVVEKYVEGKWKRVGNKPIPNGIRTLVLANGMPYLHEYGASQIVWRYKNGKLEDISPRDEKGNRYEGNHAGFFASSSGSIYLNYLGVGDHSKEISVLRKKKLNI